MDETPAALAAAARPKLREQTGRFLASSLFALAAIAFLPNSALAWWNGDWELRKQITIDTGPSGANITDPVGTMPVLIRLHAGNFRFGDAKDDGSDLRFVAGDDKTPLKHHIEKYDSLLGEAFIWVNVPEIKPGTKAGIWLYYANKKAQTADDAKGTYDPDTLLVYHFGERGAPPRDSTQWANHAQNAGQTASGAIIADGLHLDGRTPLTLPATPSLALPENGALTWSVWVKPAALQRNAIIYSRRDGPNSLVIGMDDGAPFVEVTANGSTQRSANAAPATPGSWHHLALTATPGLVTLYLDGNAYGTLNASIPPLNSAAFLGGDAQAPAAGEGASQAPASPEAQGFTGDIDELEISKTARPAGFIKAEATGQGPEHEKLLGYGQDEETASWLNGYFAIILKSVTLDGWIVIGLLMIMAVVSWAVMVSKTIYINRQSKANARFKKHFHQFATGLTVLGTGSEHDVESLGGRIRENNRSVVVDSSLYRIYRTGADELRSRFASASTPLVLSSQSLAAIRSVLDGAFVAETQRLNSLVVLLTLAISGGPFLGLLGTVIGVMITFAAIAASGDVNVNAIAPGIAAALVATVAGLGVAIPALFGYNYLISRIKDLTADMQIFVDEFTTKMAESFDTSAGREARSLAAE